MILIVIAFIGVASLVGGVAVVLRGEGDSKVEDRLDILTGAAHPVTDQKAAKNASVLSQPLDAMPGIYERILNRFGNFNRIFEQADTTLTMSRLGAVSAIMALVGAGMGAGIGLHFALLPVLGLFSFFLPLMWVLWRRKKRLKMFGAQLPDALDMLARSLRAGQSLPAGFNAVYTEMSPPVAKEFGRVFEEQNLGIPMDESLEGLVERVPNLDLRFFVTAVILQRQTGGDLAEILDKIGHLIRERFQIWGQIQALTGEGRMSGAVLLGLPFALALAVYQLNPDYLMKLFTDPLGQKMLAGALVLQVLGAICIKKIIDIKV